MTENASPVARLVIVDSAVVTLGVPKKPALASLPSDDDTLVAKVDPDVQVTAEIIDEVAALLVEPDLLVRLCLDDSRPRARRGYGYCHQHDQPQHSLHVASPSLDSERP